MRITVNVYTVCDDYGDPTDVIVKLTGASEAGEDVETITAFSLTGEQDD
jgi:hypothetical protein